MYWAIRQSSGMHSITVIRRKEWKGQPRIIWRVLVARWVVLKNCVSVPGSYYMRRYHFYMAAWLAG